MTGDPGARLRHAEVLADMADRVGAVARRDRLPTMWGAVRFSAKAALLRCARTARDLGGVRRHGQRADLQGGVLLAQSVSPLWSDENSRADRGLNAGKVQNLRVAVRRLDGTFVPARETFSFWKQIGRATRRRGYVRGRELRQGCLVPSVGGGLCQLSNALYDAALRAGFEMVERHAHTAVVPGSLAEIGRDATVFWNYVDLRFRSAHDFRIEAALTADALSVRFYADRVSTSAATVSGAAHGVAREAGGRGVPSGDCARCGIEQCFRHVALERSDAEAGRTAFLLDGYWPEYDLYLRSVAERHDAVFVPLDGRRRGTRNYRWDTTCVDTVRESSLLAMRRAFLSRRLAHHGAARQRALLASSRRIALDFAKRLPYDVTHLVVMQHLLPGLVESGCLGGRTYDVLMTGLPMRDLQDALDRAYALHPDSRTLADFRVERTVWEAEERGLAAARRLVTPHTLVAARFPARAVRIPWSAASGTRRGYAAHASNSDAHIVFPASTLGRAGAYEVREVARVLGVRVLLAGPVLEAAGFWDGVVTSACTSFEAALHGGPIAVVLPAFVESQPRRLLLAAARGIPVIASEACGLDGGDGIDVVPAGDVERLRESLVRARSIMSPSSSEDTLPQRPRRP